MDLLYGSSAHIVIAIPIDSSDHDAENDVLSDLLLDRLGDHHPERAVNLQSLLELKGDVLLCDHLCVKTLAFGLYEQKLSQFFDIILFRSELQWHDNLFLLY